MVYERNFQYTGLEDFWFHTNNIVVSFDALNFPYLQYQLHCFIYSIIESEKQANAKAPSLFSQRKQYFKKDKYDINADINSCLIKHNKIYCVHLVIILCFFSQCLKDFCFCEPYSIDNTVV